MERDRNLASGITREVSGRATLSRDSTGQEPFLMPCWSIAEVHSGLAHRMMESTAFAEVSPTTTACLMGCQAIAWWAFLRIEKETSGWPPMGDSICFATRP